MTAEEIIRSAKKAKRIRVLFRGQGPGGAVSLELTKAAVIKAAAGLAKNSIPVDLEDDGWLWIG